MPLWQGFQLKEEYANADFTVNLDGIKTGKIDAGVSVHDPSVIKIKDEYYIYGSHMTTAKSKDLRTWTSVADGYGAPNRVYYMYLCTSSTFNASNLCYATSKDPEGKFDWQGSLICSGFNSETLKDTDVLDYVTEEYAKEHYITEVVYRLGN